MVRPSFTGWKNPQVPQAFRKGNPTTTVAKLVPSFCKLAQVYMALPATSVENERHFSLMNFIKTARRNRLGEEKLNALMRMHRSNYTISCFPYAKILAAWKDQKHRRLCTA